MKKLLILTMLAGLMFTPVRADNGHLAIRQSITGAEFYNTETGKSVLLNGTNYQRFDSNLMLVNFAVGVYDHAQHEEALSDMQALKYNAVRVALASNSAYVNGQIDTEYVSNFVDFLQIAEAKGIYVVVISGYVPASLMPPVNADFERFAFNEILLAPGLAEAKAFYFIELFNELIAQNAPLETIAGFEIENEPWFDLTKKPFISSTVLANNGVSYNMPADKNALIDAGMIYYMDTVRAAIKQVAPDINAGMSLASPVAWALTPGRFVRTAAMMNNSTADFFGINIYPPFTTVDQNMASLGMTVNTKPLIISEYGAYKISYPTATQAAAALVALQVETCTQYNFRGWLSYVWDSYEVQPTVNLWMATEDNNRIANALSRPDPCPTDLLQSERLTLYRLRVW
jgi:hypothetical protein